MTMMKKCFGIGLNKTGTKTLGAALHALGYRTASFRGDLMDAFDRGAYGPILATARDFDGFEDWPWPLLYRELDEAFPNSKFVLTLRDNPDTWFDSLSAHAKRTGPTAFRKIAYGYADPWENAEHHRCFYARHAADVKSHFKGRSDQLLCVSWESGDGWPELCRFLGLPVPDVSFPHMNRRPFEPTAK